MARSFYEHIETKIIENFDFQQYARIINEHVSQKGYITPEELQEAWLGIPSMARGVAALGGGLARMAGDAGGRALKGVGNSFKNVAMGAGRGMYNAGARAATGIGQAGSQLGNWAGGHMDAARKAQAVKQAQDRFADLLNNPVLTPAMKDELNRMRDEAMASASA